ncbi:hypothetical protein CR513_53982, partial [Mucuna pruriens]
MGPKTHIHLQAFQTQIYINDGDDTISYKLFPGTFRGVTMQWFLSLPPRNIHTFNDLAMTFVSARTGKHIEAKEDQFDKIHAEKDIPTNKEDTPPLRKHAKRCDDSIHPLKVRRAQILREVYHTQLLDIPLPTGRQLGSSRDKWCKFHCTHGHTMKDYRTLQSQIEKLIYSSHLGRFVHGQDETEVGRHDHLGTLQAKNQCGETRRPRGEAGTRKGDKIEVDRETRAKKGARVEEQPPTLANHYKTFRRRINREEYLLNKAKVDQHIARRCYEASLKAESKRAYMTGKEIGRQSNIHLLELNPQLIEEAQCP